MGCDRRNEGKWSIKDTPVEGLWTDSLELIPLLPPGAPAGVLETHAVGDGILLAGHAAPLALYILLLPIMREVVDLALWLGVEGGVVWDGVVGYGDKEDGEITGEGGRDGHGGQRRGERACRRSAGERRRERKGRRGRRMRLEERKRRGMFAGREPRWLGASEGH